MDIKKLTPKQISDVAPANKQESVPNATPAGSDPARQQDTLSLSSYTFRQDELLFAKMEYQKLTKTAFEKLRDVKNQIDEYKTTSEVSQKDAAETIMGKKLNDPSVWEKIARKISES